jgi:hypothetical protein
VEIELKRWGGLIAAISIAPLLLMEAGVDFSTTSVAHDNDMKQLTSRLNSQAEALVEARLGSAQSRQVWRRVSFSQT